ncbi:ATP-dependent sacrificial sulfur transferase LarE [Tuwongella immobilis]|nr:ATP-dependent sacrificial sulfur transferase LarE [Tuwongella immobilis]
MAILRSMNRVVVAFSGGVDSAVVAKAAALALGDSAVAITADSPSVPRHEIAEAVALAAMIGIRHECVTTSEFESENYRRNDGSRCYHCKDSLYSEIEAWIGDRVGTVICSGANLDDRGDYRPGLTAAAEHRVRHPLQEAGCDKATVRLLAKHWSLPVWDKPASPCLSSRLAPGLTVTPERTARVEAAEQILRNLGLRECRVRYHEGDLARIEVPMERIATLAEPAIRIGLLAQFQAIGFRFVTLDLEGFRSGSMNGLIALEVKQRYADPTESR